MREEREEEEKRKGKGKKGQGASAKPSIPGWGCWAGMGAPAPSSHAPMPKGSKGGRRGQQQGGAVQKPAVEEEKSHQVRTEEAGQRQ